VADLALTSEQELLRNTARDFVARECSLADVRRIREREGGFSRDLWTKVAALGWAGILVPQEHDGEGGTLTDAAVLFEELGRGLLPVPLLSSGVLAAQIVLQAGSDEQQRRLLPAIASGDMIVALALTEPDYGWDEDHVQMRAVERDGSYVLDGTKRFVVDAGCAHQLIVVARTGDGVSLFLVPSDAPGLHIEPMSGFTGDALFDVSFDGVQVLPENLIGASARGWAAIEPALDIATALLCAYAAGATRRVYEMTMDYAAQREQFGQPIARFQRVQDRLIDIVNAGDVARWTAYEAAWKLEHGKPGAQETVSVAKAVASEGFYQACEAAHHVHAGIGSDKAYGLYLYTQSSRSLYHHLGDPAFHRRRLAHLLSL